MGAVRRERYWRIAVYIRLSREDGGEESESVINQKKILNEFIGGYFSDSYEIADYYVDDGLSGTNDTRADFMRMISDIESENVNCVVCKTLSRAFRNYSDQGYYLECYFQQKNVRFISTGDPMIDTYLNPEVITGLEVPITGLMNDRYAAKTSSDIRRTFNTKRRNGEFIGAFAPYGYLKDPSDKNKLILDEKIALVKRDVYGWIVGEGMSLNGAAKRLNKLGIPNPTAYKASLGFKYHNPNSKNNDGLWTGTTVRRILLDRVNLGCMVQGKQRVVSYKVHDMVAVPEEEWFVKENTHEPTFSREEFDVLEKLLKRDTRAPNGSQSVHLFSGFLKCGDCGKALQRKGAKGLVYYACRTYAEKSSEKCTRHSIRLDSLEQAVFQAIHMMITLARSVPRIVDEISKLPNENAKQNRIVKQLDGKKQELERLKRLSDGLYFDWKAGDISREDYLRMKERLDGQISSAKNAVSNLEQEQKKAENCPSPDNEVLAEFLKSGNIARLDRGLLAEMLDIIFVFEGKKIEVKFNFADVFSSN